MKSHSSPKMNIVCFVIILSVIQNVCSDLTGSCPPKYTISGESSNKIIVQVIRNPKSCSKLLKDTSGAIKTVRDLDPTLLVPYMKGGEYYLNITWLAKLNRDKRLPRKYIIRLAYSVPEMNISYRSECIELKLFNRAASIQQNSFTIYLDCVRLLKDTKKGEFSVQIWQKTRGTCGRYRHGRSYSPCNQVKKSGIKQYTLALDHYKHKICSCHYANNNSNPERHIHPKGSKDHIAFAITLRNLPDFFLYIDVTIRNKLHDVQTYRIHHDSMMIQNSSIVFLTESFPQKAGPFFLLFYYECVPKRAHDSVPSSRCFPSDRYNFTLDEVEENPIDVVAIDPIDLTGGVLVMLGVFVAGVIVVAIFRHRKNLLILLDPSSTKPMQEQNNNIDNDHRPLMQLSPTQGRVITLNHSQDMELVYVDILDQLRDNHIIVETGRDENWREFASGVLTPVETSEKRFVLVFVSVALLDLLLGEVHVRQRRLEERQYENVPTIVMDGLKTVDDTTRQNIDFHIVSINSIKGRELINRFTDKYAFIKRFHVNEYYFYDASLDLIDNEQEVKRLTNNLHNNSTLTNLFPQTDAF